MDGIHASLSGFIFTLDFAVIGVGLPMGVGATLATEQRSCITICGDAGFMMSIQELETAVRNDLPMTIIIMNDSSLGSEYHSLDQEGHSPDIALVSAPDFADIAEGFGADGYTIWSIDELKALSEELGGEPDGPLVVDCKVNHEVSHRSKM